MDEYVCFIAYTHGKLDKLTPCKYSVGGDSLDVCVVRVEVVISPVHTLEDPGFQIVRLFSERFEPQCEVEPWNGYLGHRQQVGTTETRFKSVKIHLSHSSDMKIRLRHCFTETQMKRE